MPELLKSTGLQDDTTRGDVLIADSKEADLGVDKAQKKLGALAIKYAFEEGETINSDNIGAITAPLYMSNIDTAPKEVKLRNIPYTPPAEAYTEEQLRNNPVLKYHVDPNLFPILALQSEHQAYNDEGRRLPLDYTLSRFLGYTASTIAVLAGEDNNFRNQNKLPAADHIVYLDKSARPVSWLVNKFWDDFTDKKRPDSSYLAIDRSPWLQRAGQDVDQDGRFTPRSGQNRLATFDDFLRGEKYISKNDLAKVRALYIEGGIDTEDPDIIMQMPTILDGKNVTVIDEVERTGTTANIATYLLKRAIPEIKSVGYYSFWHPVPLKNNSGDDTQMSSVPVWYDARRISGRGVSEINPIYYRNLYNENPTSVNRARMFGAELLGTPFNPESEQNMDAHSSSPSLELFKEIGEMHTAWANGNIFLPPTVELGRKYMDYMKKEGLTGMVDDRFGDIPPSTSVTAVSRKLKERPATNI